MLNKLCPPLSFFSQTVSSQTQKAHENTRENSERIALPRPSSPQFLAYDAECLEKAVSFIKVEINGFFNMYMHMGMCTCVWRPEVAVGCVALLLAHFIF